MLVNSIHSPKSSATERGRCNFIDYNFRRWWRWSTCVEDGFEDLRKVSASIRGWVPALASVVPVVEFASINRLKPASSPDMLPTLEGWFLAIHHLDNRAEQAKRVLRRSVLFLFVLHKAAAPPRQVCG